MKLLKTDTKINPRDSFGQGLDAVITVVVFFGIGFFLDRWLGTTPWLMLVFAVLGGIGVFYRLKARYDASMNQHSGARPPAGQPNAGDPNAGDSAPSDGAPSDPAPSDGAPSDPAPSDGMAR